MDQKISNKNTKQSDWFAVAPGVWGLKDIFVNIYMIHNPSTNQWVLIDAGLKTSAPPIRNMAANLFSPQIIPSGIKKNRGAAAENRAGIIKKRNRKVVKILSKLYLSVEIANDLAGIWKPLQQFNLTTV